MTGQCVTLDTEQGAIVIEMLPAKAPETVRSFLNLAEGNVINNFKDDGYFGSSSYNTLFRNRIAGEVKLKHFSDYYNIVGNVLVKNS